MEQNKVVSEAQRSCVCTEKLNDRKNKKKGDNDILKRKQKRDTKTKDKINAQASLL